MAVTIVTDFHLFISEFWLLLVIKICDRTLKSIIVWLLPVSKIRDHTLKSIIFGYYS